MEHASQSTPEHVAALLAMLEARAAGYWRVEGDHLTQVAFAPCAGLPESVARDFAAATRTVPLDQTTLGIVQAVLRAEVTISRAEDRPPDVGSGYWLRAFGAVRSVAVPITDEMGAVRGVMSVALADDTAETDSVARLIGETIG